MSDAPAGGMEKGSLGANGDTFESLLVDSMKVALKEKEEEHAQEMLEMLEQLRDKDTEIQNLKAQLSALLSGAEDEVGEEESEGAAKEDD